MDADTLLVRLLGELHALYWPLRRPESDCWAVIWELRRGYPTCGIPWRPGGDRAAIAAFDKLVRRRLVYRRRGAAKTVAFRLSLAGLAEAERLIGDGPGCGEVFVAALLGRRPAGQWVPEIALNDGRGWGDGQAEGLAVIADTALPALTRAWAESNCDVHGRVGYRVTRLGVEALKRWDGRYEHVPSSRERLAEYAESFAEALQRLQSLPRPAREIGEIPLAASEWQSSRPAATEQVGD